MAGVPRDPRGRVILTVGPALLGGLAGGAEPGADLGPGVAAGAQALDRLGAGDGDRTRTISLGIWTVCARTWPDLRAWRSASDREEPLLPGANGTLMARAMGAGRGCRPSPRHQLGRSGVRDRRPRRSGHAADSWQLARVNDRQVPWVSLAYGPYVARLKSAWPSVLRLLVALDARTACEGETPRGAVRKNGVGICVGQSVAQCRTGTGRALPHVGQDDPDRA